MKNTLKILSVALLLNGVMAAYADHLDPVRRSAIYSAVTNSDWSVLNNLQGKDEIDEAFNSACNLDQADLLIGLLNKYHVISPQVAEMQALYAARSPRSFDLILPLVPAERRQAIIDQQMRVNATTVNDALVQHLLQQYNPSHEVIAEVCQQAKNFLENFMLTTGEEGNPHHAQWVESKRQSIELMERKLNSSVLAEESH